MEPVKYCVDFGREANPFEGRGGRTRRIGGLTFRRVGGRRVERGQRLGNGRPSGYPSNSQPSKTASKAPHQTSQHQQTQARRLKRTFTIHKFKDLHLVLLNFPIAITSNHNLSFLKQVYTHRKRSMSCYSAIVLLDNPPHCDKTKRKTDAVVCRYGGSVDGADAPSHRIRASSQPIPHSHIQVRVISNKRHISLAMFTECRVF